MCRSSIEFRRSLVKFIKPGSLLAGLTLLSGLAAATPVTGTLGLSGYITVTQYFE